MSIITDIDDAKERLSFEIQAALPPVVADADLEAILAKVKRAAVWATGTVYAVNDVVIPATENGMRYVVTRAGTSGATEPSWPTRTRGTVADGTATLQEAGSQYDLWDMDEAIHEGWKLKKAMAVVYIGGEDGLSDVYEHCAEMAERSKPLKVA
jgi:hypothetical protein